MRYKVLTASVLMLAFTTITPAYADDRVPDDVKEFFATKALEDMRLFTIHGVVGV